MGKQEKKLTKLEYKAQLQKDYQAWKVLGVAGYVNDDKEKLARDLIEKIATKLDIIPSYFATIILTEGLGVNFMNLPSNYETKAPFGIRNDIVMNGFDIAGVDDFGSEFSRYKKYLPATYNEGTSKADFAKGAEFIKEVRTNEQGDKTTSAEFSNLESIIWAFGATLAHRRDTFERKRKEKGFPTPTEDEMAYWTYMFYQGEGRAALQLSKAKSLDIFGRNGCYPNCNVTLKTRTPNDVALSNLASWHYLKSFNIFSR